jgi:hypothetical protein
LHPYARIVSQPTADPTDPSAPLVWRIPAWQPAVLLLLVCGALALNLYGSPSSVVRVITLALGAAALVMAVGALRMYMVVDRYGIGFRGLLRTHNIDWSDVSQITVVHSKISGPTLRISRRDSTYADVPASLMLPTKPTGTAKTLAQLGAIARMIITYGDMYHPRGR